MATMKIVLFHILLSLRSIILASSKLLALAFFGAALVIYLNDISNIAITTKIMLVTLGLFFTAINWFYDYLILYLKPKMLDVILLK